MNPSEEVKNAVIESARIEINEQGFLDCWLMLEYGGISQWFGGWTLYLPSSFGRHKLESTAGHYIYRVMQIAGVERFDALAGKAIRAKCAYHNIWAIGHIIKDDWFCPDADFAVLRRANLTVEEAQRAGVCRICKINDKASPGNPLVLNYGLEYAHAECIAKEEAGR